MKLKYIAVYLCAFSMTMGIGWSFGVDFLVRGSDLGFCLLLSLLIGVAAVAFFATEIWINER